MELTLAHQTQTEITVTCDGQHSHTFDMRTLSLNDEKEQPRPPDNPVAYGEAVYLALFPPGTHARHVLETMPERLLLVTTDSDLDAVPWEYAYGPDGFLVLECHFVRGLPIEQRIDPPILDGGLHIVAVPSNPLDKSAPTLNVDGEWVRLKEIIQQVPYAITLERTRPPTIEQVHRLVAKLRHCIVHFMGHGRQDESAAVLYFEQDNGDLEKVTAEQFILPVPGSVFLATLNACVSATPGPTAFSNFAAALVWQKMPYTLGMRFSIYDEDARAFSRTFYSELAQGTPIEEALRQARFTLAHSARPQAIGTPVLYTALAQPVAGFPRIAGSAITKEQQPRIEVSALPRAEGIFQGRREELRQLGTILTGDNRPPLVTIHGGGGQGKTALAREAVERFAYAWPGGIWATSLENLPSRDLFVSDLARFLGIDTQKALDPNEVERLVITHLELRGTLIVLDNAETFVESLEAGNEEAIRLAGFLREQLPKPPVSLLTTSRSFLGWENETVCELTGLTPAEGVRLFQQHAPQRLGDIDPALTWRLSERIEGQPLSLRLLGSAFNASDLALSSFIEEYEGQLLHAENKYVALDHRHRTLYASIETSVRFLPGNRRELLSCLWVFHSPFLVEAAAAVFTMEFTEIERVLSSIQNSMVHLWQQGLLVRKTISLPGGPLYLFQLLPTTRPYIERHLEQIHEPGKLLKQFGASYFRLAASLYHELDSSASAVAMAQQGREDLERGMAFVEEGERGDYLLYYGWILYRLGNARRGLELLERALEIAQGENRQLVLQAYHHLAMAYQDIGYPQRALALFQQILPIWSEMGDHIGIASTLTNIGVIYRNLGRPGEALKLYEQALLIRHEVGDRTGEAKTYNNMALLYEKIGQSGKAADLYEQALAIHREVGDRAGEAVTLANQAGVYQDMGQTQQALDLYEQALPIMHELGDLVREAIVLNNVATLYNEIGKTEQALALYKQILDIRREVGDRTGEAVTLTNIATSYRQNGYLRDALPLYEQALLVMQEVGYREQEASILTQMAKVHQIIGQPEDVLPLLKQALTIRREVGDQAGEAKVLSEMATLFKDMHCYEEASTYFEQSILLSRQIVHPALEVDALVGYALLLYRLLNQTERAIPLMEQAISIIPPDTSRPRREELQGMLTAMRNGASVDHFFLMPQEVVQQVITNTIAVLTTSPSRYAQWCEIIVKTLHRSQQQAAEYQIEVDFFNAILDIFAGRSPALAPDHPYAAAVASILDGISG